jgi:hypothetical protein
VIYQLLFILVFLVSCANTQGKKGKADNRALLIPQKGLMLDLDATKGLKLNSVGRVLSWTNQVKTATAKIFKPNPIGRKNPERGIPSFLPKEKSVGKYPTIQFRCQELINHKEDVFDKLTQGTGHTWIGIIAVYDQTSDRSNTHAFFGNLCNGEKYEGFWGVIHDDRKFYVGTRNGINFERNGINNPEILSKTILEKKRLYLVAGRMAAGTGEVKVELFLNSHIPENQRMTPVNPKSNPSKMAIGQERDATNHPGAESFDGEISRFLIYDRPLSGSELQQLTNELIKHYGLKK